MGMTGRVWKPPEFGPATAARPAEVGSGLPALFVYECGPKTLAVTRAARGRSRRDAGCGLSICPVLAGRKHSSLEPREFSFGVGYADKLIKVHEIFKYSQRRGYGKHSLDFQKRTAEV
jgi:hypothetical protein